MDCRLDTRWTAGLLTYGLQDGFQMDFRMALRWTSGWRPVGRQDGSPITVAHDPSEIECGSDNMVLKQIKFTLV